MKIVCFDNVNGKTTREIWEHWDSQGHEVKHSMGYNDKWCEWADIAWFEWLDSNIQIATQGRPDPDNKGEWKLKPLSLMGHKPKVIVRAVDIEIWVGRHKQVIWDDINAFTYLSPVIRDLVLTECPVLKEKIDKGEIIMEQMQLGIDLDKWKFKERNGSNKKMAFISHRWSAKGLGLFAQIAKKLIDIDNNWTFHIVGTRSNERWLHAYFEHILKEMGIFKHFEIIENKIPSIQEFLEDKDYMVTTHFKDAFSLVVGEAMASGIKTYAHNFPGAKDIWGKYVWTTIDEVVDRVINEPYNSKEYRQYVADNHDIKFAKQRWDNLISKLK